MRYRPRGRFAQWRYNLRLPIPRMLERLTDPAVSDYDFHQAVERLHDVRNDAAVPILLGELDGPDQYRRHRAARGLNYLRDRRAIEPVIRRLRQLLGDPNSDFDDVGPLIYALTDIREPEAILPLTEVLIEVLRDERAYWDEVGDRDYQLAGDTVIPRLMEFGGLDLVLRVLADAFHTPETAARVRAARLLANVVWRHAWYPDEWTPPQQQTLRDLLAEVAGDESANVAWDGRSALENVDRWWS
jgi:HEAT repeat protein